jgi:hypothetical protein
MLPSLLAASLLSDTLAISYLSEMVYTFTTLCALYWISALPSLFLIASDHTSTLHIALSFLSASTMIYASNITQQFAFIAFVAAAFAAPNQTLLHPTLHRATHLAKTIAVTRLCTMMIILLLGADARSTTFLDALYFALEPPIRAPIEIFIAIAGSSRAAGPVGKAASVSIDIFISTSLTMTITNMYAKNRASIEAAIKRTAKERHSQELARVALIVSTCYCSLVFQLSSGVLSDEVMLIAGETPPILTSNAFKFAYVVILVSILFKIFISIRTLQYKPHAHSPHNQPQTT